MNYVHSSSPASDAGPKKAAHIQDLEKKISAHLGTRVSIKPGRKKGSGALTLQFNSLQQFDALMAQLGIELEDE